MKNRNPILFNIVGMPGSGKTTIAKKLHGYLAMEGVSVDRLEASSIATTDPAYRKNPLGLVKSDTIDQMILTRVIRSAMLKDVVVISGWMRFMTQVADVMLYHGEYYTCINVIVHRPEDECIIAMSREKGISQLSAYNRYVQQKEIIDIMSHMAKRPFHIEVQNGSVSEDELDDHLDNVIDMIMACTNSIRALPYVSEVIL